MAQVVSQNESSRTLDNPSVSITDVQAGDVLIALDAGNYADTAEHLAAISGCGATWSRISGGENLTFALWVGVGATADDSVVGSGASLPLSTNRVLVVWKVRGATSTAAAVEASSPSGPSATTPAQAAGPGQVVIGAGYSSDADDAISDLVPADGWNEPPAITLHNSRYAGTAYRAPSTPADHQLTATRSSHAYIVQVRVGDLETASPSGTLDATLPALTADLSGTYTAPPPPTYTGDLAATLPAVEASLSGTYQAPPVGNLAARLPALTATLSGTYTTAPDVDTFGDLAVVLPSLAATLGGTYTAPPEVIPSGALVATLPALTAALTGAYVGPTLEEATTDRVNRSNGRTRVMEWTVEVEPPVVEPTRTRGHDYATAATLAVPTLIDGRPT